MRLTPRRQAAASPLEKNTIAWGDQHAGALWDKLYGRYDPPVDGRVVLDLGCSWGYMLKFLAKRFRARKMIGTDLSPWWEIIEHGWDYASLGDRLEFYAGDLATDLTLPPRSVDLVLCTSVFQYMTPDALEANLEAIYDLLVPGGQAIIRTRCFTSYIGADLHSDFIEPFVHLRFGEPQITAVLAEVGRAPKQVNWLTASTYVGAFTRAGFEALDVRRRYNRGASPELFADVVHRFPWVSEDELACAEVEALLLRPFEAGDLGLFSPNAPLPARR